MSKEIQGEVDISFLRPYLYGLEGDDEDVIVYRLPHNALKPKFSFLQNYFKRFEYKKIYNPESGWVDELRLQILQGQNYKIV
jgi:hypothetical protein